MKESNEIFKIIKVNLVWNISLRTDLSFCQGKGIFFLTDINIKWIFLEVLIKNTYLSEKGDLFPNCLAEMGIINKIV